MVKGQILEDSDFGQSIIDLIVKYQPENIVEIGTWKGLGSTLCIIQGIKKARLKQFSFISLESSLEFHNEAKKNLEGHLDYVKLLHGRLVEISDVIEFCMERKDLVNNDWLVGDLYNMSLNNNIFNQIPNKIDFLLLDGGEYSTYLEWQKLKDRTYIVALDDTAVMKTREINNDLLKDENYEQLLSSNARNGFSIFRRLES